jgi:hypothetical protein
MKSYLTTEDYEMPDNLNIFGDLSEGALNASSAMNAAQRGKKYSQNLQDAYNEVTTFLKNKKPEFYHEPNNPLSPPPVGGGGRSVWNTQTGMYETKYTPGHQVFAGSYYDVDQEGNLITEATKLSEAANKGVIFMPFASAAGAGVTGPPQTSSSNVVPYGATDPSGKLYQPRRATQTELAQREWEDTPYYRRSEISPAFAARFPRQAKTDAQSQAAAEKAQKEYYIQKYADVYKNQPSLLE